jgi:hypothetical protein
MAGVDGDELLSFTSEEIPMNPLPNSRRRRILSGTSAGGFLSAAWLLALTFTLNFAVSPIAQAQGGLASRFTRKPPRLDGQVGWGEWEGANVFSFEHGFVAAMNDDTRLYLLIDVLGQTSDDPQDYFWVSFDVDRDGAITPRKDLNFTLDADTRSLRYQQYLGPGEWSSLFPETDSGKGQAFNSFLADQSTRVDFPKSVVTSRHRVWELGIDLAEIGAQPGGQARLGLRIASPRLQFIDEVPAGFSRDFKSLIPVDLARFVLPIPVGDSNAVISLASNPLEVTQAIQNRFNTLPLVQDKTTVARLYLNVSGTTQAQPLWVYLYGKRGGIDLPGSPLTKLVTVPTSVNRTHLADTPWFVLPASWGSGTVEFKVKFRTTFGAQTTSGPINLTFTPKVVPTFWVVPINTGSASSPVLASDAEILSQQSYLETVYPLADVTFVRKSWTAVGPTTVANTIAGLRTYYNTAVVAWIFGLLFTGSSPFDLPMQIYGLTPSGGGISDPVWCGGFGYVARGYRGSSLEATMAHEINHNLDRDPAGTWGHHTPFGCGATGPDPSWPYANANIQEVGFDTRSPIDADHVVPQNFPDVMSYCQSGALPTKWVSPYRW